MSSIHGVMTNTASTNITTDRKIEIGRAGRALWYTASRTSVPPRPCSMHRKHATKGANPRSVAE